jgi:hypothetical protein
MHTKISFLIILDHDSNFYLIQQLLDAFSKNIKMHEFLGHSIISNIKINFISEYEIIKMYVSFKIIKNLKIIPSNFFFISIRN